MGNKSDIFFRLETIRRVKLSVLDEQKKALDLMSAKLNVVKHFVFISWEISLPLLKELSLKVCRQCPAHLG